MARLRYAQGLGKRLRRLRQSDDPLKRWGEHIAQTRGTSIAAVAVARKLAGVLWAMWRDGTVYDRAWQAEQTAKGVARAANQQQNRAQALQVAARKLQRGTSAQPEKARATKAKGRTPLAAASAV